MIFQPIQGGTISSLFGANRGTTNHSGLDIATTLGAPIDAAIGGTVIASGYNGSYGYSVSVLDDSGLIHLYAHMKEPSPLQVGDTVTGGQSIGLVGSTGNSTGPHLHYEITEQATGKKINPTGFLGNSALFGDKFFPNDTEKGIPDYIIKGFWLVLGVVLIAIGFSITVNPLANISNVIGGIKNGKA